MCIELFKLGRLGKRKKLCILNFHTAFVLDPAHEPRADETGTINFPKSRLGKLAKDKMNKKAPGQFHVVLTLLPFEQRKQAPQRMARTAGGHIVPFEAVHAALEDV